MRYFDLINAAFRSGIQIDEHGGFELKPEQMPFFAQQLERVEREHRVFNDDEEDEFKF